MFHRDVVWRLRSEVGKNEGKFKTNWEGPFHILMEVENEVYHLEHLSDKPIPRTYNVSHLKFYFS